MATASSFNMAVGSLRGQSNAGAVLEKAKKDRLAMLQAQAPDFKDKSSTDMASIGGVAGALKVGDGVKKVMDKVSKVKSAVQKLGGGTTSGVNDVVDDVKSLSARSDVGTMGDRFSRVLGKDYTPLGGGGGAKPPTKMNVSSMIDGSANNQMDKLTSALGSKADGVISDAKGALRSTATNLHSAVMGAGGEDAMNAITKGVGVASKAMETGASVLDAMGPIGDVLGIGLSIFGGIEAHHEKMKEQESVDTAKQEVAKPISAPSAPTTNVSLDTSKGTPMSVASHY
jgi:hypothetical protein